MPTISSSAVRSHAEATLEHLKNSRKMTRLQAECTAALALMKQTDAFITCQAGRSCGFFWQRRWTRFLLEEVK